MTHPLHAASLDMLGRLIAFDTTSALSNLDLIAFIRAYLAERGVESRLVHDATGQKANLFATIGPRDRAGVALSGHTDVVPVAGQSWSSDPFQAVIRDGRLHGRGACDMKGFIACALVMLDRFLEQPLATPIHYAFTYDEEVGCYGARTLIDSFRDHAPKPRLAIVGEPTDMLPVNRHKGACSFRCTIRGVEAHSSKPHLGANANMAAGKLIAKIAEMVEEFRAKPSVDTDFEPPYTTFNVGMMNGGTAPNIIPNHAEFRWEARCVPEDDPAEIGRRLEAYANTVVLPWLKAQHNAAEIVMETVNTLPGLLADPDGEAETLVRRLTGKNIAGAVPYGTEGGLFQRAGIPAVIIGPGSIDQAHQADEFVSLEQMDLCLDFLDKLTAECRAG